VKWDVAITEECEDWLLTLEVLEPNDIVRNRLAQGAVERLMSGKLIMQALVAAGMGGDEVYNASTPLT